MSSKESGFLGRVKDASLSGIYPKTLQEVLTYIAIGGTQNIYPSGIFLKDIKSNASEVESMGFTFGKDSKDKNFWVVIRGLMDLTKKMPEGGCGEVFWRNEEICSPIFFMDVYIHARSQILEVHHLNLSIGRVRGALFVITNIIGENCVDDNRHWFIHSDGTFSVNSPLDRTTTFFVDNVI